MLRSVALPILSSLVVTNAFTCIHKIHILHETRIKQNNILINSIFTPPRNRGGVIFSLQFVCLCVCVCVCMCVCLSVCPFVNKMPIKPLHRFRRGYRQMVAYITGSDPIEICDLGSKVKVTVTKKVCKN